MVTRLIVVGLLVLGIVLNFVPGATAAGPNKVLVSGLLPGEVVSVFTGGDPKHVFGQDGSPDGTLLGSAPGSADGKPVQVYVPVGEVSKLYVWSEKEGFKPLARVKPGSSDYDTFVTAHLPAGSGAAKVNDSSSDQADDSLDATLDDWNDNEYDDLYDDLNDDLNDDSSDDSRDSYEDDSSDDSGDDSSDDSGDDSGSDSSDGGSDS